MLNDNEIKYNLYYIFRVNCNDIIEFSIFKIDINIKLNTLNTLKSFRLLFNSHEFDSNTLNTIDFANISKNIRIRHISNLRLKQRYKLIMLFDFF